MAELMPDRASIGSNPEWTPRVGQIGKGKPKILNQPRRRSGVARSSRADLTNLRIDVATAVAGAGRQSRAGQHADRKLARIEILIGRETIIEHSAEHAVAVEIGIDRSENVGADVKMKLPRSGLHWAAWIAVRIQDFHQVPLEPHVRPGRATRKRGCRPSMRECAVE